MKAIKSYWTLLVVALFAVSLTSCKDDDNELPNINGTWETTDYQVDSEGYQVVDAEGKPIVLGTETITFNNGIITEQYVSATDEAKNSEFKGTYVYAGTTINVTITERNGETLETPEQVVYFVPEVTDTKLTLGTYKGTDVFVTVYTKK